MTDENQQPTPSPDWRSCLNLVGELHEGSRFCNEDMPLVHFAAHTIKLLLASPKALEAMGLCKLDAAELSKHGFFEASKELTLNSEIEAFKRQVDSLKAELKAVREMRDRLLDEVKKYYFDRNFPVNPSGGLIKDAEAQIAAEKGKE